MNRVSDTAKLVWVNTTERTPLDDQEVLCAVLNRFTNAPWKWSFFMTSFSGGNWGRYCTPDKWALIPELAIPDLPEHAAALKVHEKAQQYEIEKRALDRKYGR